MHPQIHEQINMIHDTYRKKDPGTRFKTKDKRIKSAKTFSITVMRHIILAYLTILFSLITLP